MKNEKRDRGWRRDIGRANELNGEGRVPAVDPQRVAARSWDSRQGWQVGGGGHCACGGRSEREKWGAKLDTQRRSGGVRGETLSVG